MVIYDRAGRSPGQYGYGTPPIVPADYATPAPSASSSNAQLLSRAYLAHFGQLQSQFAWVDHAQAPVVQNPDPFAFKWGGRGENPNPFFAPAIQTAAVTLAQRLGQSAQVAYQAAAQWADDHYAAMKEFATDGSAPEIIWDEIKRRIYAIAGVPEPAAVQLTPDQRAAAAQIADTHQQDLKARDAQEADFNDYTDASVALSFVAGAAFPGGGTAASLLEQNLPDKPADPSTHQVEPYAKNSITIPRSSSPVPAMNETRAAADLEALRQAYGERAAPAVRALTNSFVNPDTMQRIDLAPGAPVPAGFQLVSDQQKGTPAPSSSGGSGGLGAAVMLLAAVASLFAALGRS